MHPRLQLRGVTREQIQQRARESMRRQRVGMAWIGGLIPRDAYLDLLYLKEQWGLKAHRQAVALSLQYFAQATRDGLIHPGVPGSEDIPPR